MTEPFPLPRASPDYHSVGPYIVSFEWADGRIITRIKDGLVDALQDFWSMVPLLGQPGSPDRRIVVDARGIAVLGCLDQRASTEDWIATHEVIRHLRDLGCDSDEVTELELRVMWASEVRRP